MSLQISVAMATWNGEHFLEEQLASILGQTRLPDQMVISDDASTDGTLPILEGFADEAPFDVLLLRNQSRAGFVGNFLRAMRACTGDIIALADQDDAWDSRKLELCERPLLDDPGIVTVIHSAQAVDEHMRPIPADPAASGVPRRAKLPPGSLAPFSSGWAGCMMLFRSRLLFGLPDEALPRERDGPDPMLHDQWLTLVGNALGYTLLLPDVLLSYRRHPSTATDSWTGHHSVPALVRRSQRTMALWRWGRMVRGAVANSNESVDYLARAERARARSGWLTLLRPLAASMGPSAVSGLERTIAAHEQYAVALGHRAEAYALPGRISRGVAIARSLSKGDYRGRTTGGLGWTSLVRDLILAVTR